MARTIETVGVVGTGVIGASWTALFLAHGLRVLVSDPAPDAEQHLAAYLKGVWPSLQQLGLHQDASLSNCTFVGKNFDDHCGKVDFIQEVTYPLVIWILNPEARVDHIIRMHQRNWI